MKTTQIEKTLADTTFGFGTTELGHMLADVINNDTDKYSSFDLGVIKRLRPDFERILKAAKAIIAKQITVEVETIKTLTTDEVEILVVAGVFQRMRECGFNSIAAGWSKFWNEPETKPAQSRFDKQILTLVTNQINAQKLALCEESDAIRWTCALAKAERIALTNKTIEFRNNILKFVSQDSLKQRTVSAAGCHESCDCLGKTSYHHGLYLILERYCQIVDEERLSKTNFPVISKTEIVAVAHSQKQQADRFTEANMPYFPKPLYTERKSESLTKDGPRF